MSYKPCKYTKFLLKIQFSFPNYKEKSKDSPQVGKIGAKHILHAKNEPTAHIFKHLICEMNSQHPYLLGFDSNLAPNSNNFIISVISL